MMTAQTYRVESQRLTLQASTLNRARLACLARCDYAGAAKARLELSKIQKKLTDLGTAELPLKFHE